MVAVRKKHRSFGRGHLKFIYPANRRILAFLREFEGETILCVANISRLAQAVQLDLARFAGAVPIELTGGGSFPAISAAPYILTLPAYGYYWFALADEKRLPHGIVLRPSRCPSSSRSLRAAAGRACSRHLRGAISNPRC